MVHPEGLAATSEKVNRNIKKDISYKQETSPEGM
jgi:hypothetical protein